MKTHLSLFSGIGGLDLAAEMAGFTTVCQCEWADYPTKVLEKHWPDVPKWRDIRTLTQESFYEKTGLRTIDIISGGFPCQPFSTAGKRRGSADDRYLWPEMLRVISEIRPRWVVGENVAGIVSMALDQVLSDLEGIGYSCEALTFPACAVDAPHRRDRVCIVANCHRPGQKRFEQHGTSVSEGQSPPGATGKFRKTVSDTDNKRFRIGRHEPGIPAVQPENGVEQPCCDDAETIPDCDNGSRYVRWDRKLSETERPGEPWSDNCGRTPEYGCGEWRSAQPGLGGMADGLPNWLDRGMSQPGSWMPDPHPEIPRVASGIKNRVDRLKCLGNAVVPQQFYPVFGAIMELEEGL